MLCAVVSVEDANEVEASATNLANRFEQLANHTRVVKDILTDLAGQVTKNKYFRF